VSFFYLIRLLLAFEDDEAGRGDRPDRQQSSAMPPNGESASLFRGAAAATTPKRH